MDWLFLERIHTARVLAGTPFLFSSAYRTVQHELKMGRDGTSSHTKGIAIDIQYSTWEECFKIVTALLKVGFTRIIIYRSWIHVDSDPDKPSPILGHK